MTKSTTSQGTAEGQVSGPQCPCTSTAASAKCYSLQGGRGQMYDEFVGGHHDGCVWDLADQVCQQPPVQRQGSLLTGHELQSLGEGTVPRAFLSQPCPNDLCRDKKGSHVLAEGSCRHVGILQAEASYRHLSSRRTEARRVDLLTVWICNARSTRFGDSSSAHKSEEIVVWWKCG